jgi:hypothetical protein
MITSVTSATEFATSASSGWATALGVGGAILLIGLLVARELLGPGQGPIRTATERVLRIMTGPLLVVFAVSVAVRAIAIILAP